MKFLLGFLKHFPGLVMLPVQMCHKYKLGRNKLSVNFLAYLNKGSGMLFLKQHISEQSVFACARCSTLDLCAQTDLQHCSLSGLPHLSLFNFSLLLFQPSVKMAFGTS